MSELRRRHGPGERPVEQVAGALLGGIHQGIVIFGVDKEDGNFFHQLWGVISNLGEPRTAAALRASPASSTPVPRPTQWAGSPPESAA